MSTWSRALLPILLAVGLGLESGAWTPVVAQARCTFSLGFKALHNLIPDIVGDCVTDEMYNPSAGLILQVTRNGALLWFKGENSTLFTDGRIIWSLGPDGLSSRPYDGPIVGPSSGDAPPAP